MSNRKGIYAFVLIVLTLGAILWFAASDYRFIWHLIGGPPRLTGKEAVEQRKEQTGVFTEQRQKRDEERRAGEQRRREELHQAALRVDETVRLAVEKSKHSRWTDLPKEVTGVRVDGTGRAWFSLPPASKYDHDEDLVRSVEEIFAGKAFCVRGSQPPLLVDSRGTVWVRLGRKLAGYDGKKWSYVDAEGRPTDLATWLTNGIIFDWGVEDTNGGLWFASETSKTDGTGTTQIMLHRTAEGTWKVHRLPEIERFHLSTFLQRTQLVLLEGGRLLVADSDEQQCRFAYFDGTEWKIETDLEKALDRDISWMAPMADGSIAYLEFQTETLWFHWPDSKLADNPANRQRIAELNSDDGQVRQAATVALLRNGVAIRPLLEQALARETCTPEMRLRLQSILSLAGKPSAVLTQLAEDTSDLPGRDLLPRQRYGTVRLLASRAGKALLRAVDCVDSQTEEPIPDQYIELTGDGRLRVIELSQQPWSGSADGRRYSSFVDVWDRFWLAGGCRILPDGTVQEALPAGVTATQIVGPDSDALLYLDAERILNERIGAAAPSLPEQLVLAPRSTFASAGHRLWIVEGDRWPTGLSLMVDGKGPRPIAHPWKDAGIINPLYCFGPGVLAALTGRDQDHLPDVEYAFFDGERWDTADDLSDLVKRNVAFLSEYANRSLKGNEIASFGGNAGHFWFYQYIPGFWEDGEDQFVLQLYDGQNWHDVAGALAWKMHNLTPMTLVDGGRSMILVQTAKEGNDRIWLAGLEDGRVKVRLIRELPTSGWIREVEAVYVSDQTWLRGLNNDHRISVLRGGALTDVADGNDHLLFGDSKGRGWHYDWNNKTIRVLDHGLWGKIAVDGTETTRAMGEGPDGRIWLLHGKGISQLEVTPATGQVEVREIARHLWSEQRNRVSDPCFDREGGLWPLANEAGSAFSCLSPSDLSCAGTSSLFSLRS